MGGFAVYPRPPIPSGAGDGGRVDVPEGTPSPAKPGRGESNQQAGAWYLFAKVPTGCRDLSSWGDLPEG